MKGPGKGNYQDILESITKLKLIHKLTIKPFTYELLRNETKTQRNTLRNILDYFVDKKALIPHKYNSIDFYINGYEGVKIKSGLEYYILDLGNRESLMYLRDIELDTKVKDLIKIYKVIFNSQREMLQYRTNNKKELIFCFRNPQETEYNKTIQSIRVAIDTDPSFSPLLYLLPEQKGEYYRQESSIFTRLKETNPKKYVEYMKKLNEEKTYPNNNYLPFYKRPKEIKEDVIKDLLKYCNNPGLSTYDLLIFLSWTFPSRENYIKYWNIIQNNTT